MTEKIKKQNKGYFKKKSDLIAENKIETEMQEAQSQKLDVESSKNSDVEKPSVDLQSLIRDLMFNKYFTITEKEAKPIAERMISDGHQTLHEIKWFLTQNERVSLAKELSEKHLLS